MIKVATFKVAGVSGCSELKMTRSEHVAKWIKREYCLFEEMLQPAVPVFGSPLLKQTHK